jgi:hypothetical protein
LNDEGGQGTDERTGDGVFRFFTHSMKKSASLRGSTAFSMVNKPKKVRQSKGLPSQLD